MGLFPQVTIQVSLLAKRVPIPITIVMGIGNELASLTTQALIFVWRLLPPTSASL